VTHYEVLGVPRTATPAEVRRAYLDLARRHHPDYHTKAGGSGLAAAEQEMRRINEAWQVLGDDDRRRRYDLELLDAEGPEPVWDARVGRAHPDFVPFDEGDDDPDDWMVDWDDERPGWARYVAEHDTPYAGARPVPRWQQLAPVALLGVALATMALGLVVNLPPLLGFGVVLLVFAGVAFVLTPMLAVMRGHDPDPER